MHIVNMIACQSETYPSETYQSETYQSETFERFSFPPLSSFPDVPSFRDSSFPDVPSFRSLGTRSRRTHIVLSDKPEHTTKVPIYGGVLHTVHDGTDYYALVQGRHTGKWSFPKGHLQLGETGPECALREIAEETGMDNIDHSHSIGTLFLHYGTYYLYECSGFDPLIPYDTKEIVRTKWMTLDEMRTVPLNADVSQFRKKQVRLQQVHLPLQRDTAHTPYVS